MPGIELGHHSRVGDGWLTGTTVVVAPEGGAVGGVDVRGGGPGTRETDLLDPRNLVERIHAVVLTGGSAFGLAAADGVMQACSADGVGFPVGPEQAVPIVPAAVIFDLARGGEFANRPDASFGAAAYAARSGAAPQLGNVGGGTGAQAGGLKGGFGTASAVLSDGTTVAAAVVANPVGSTVHLGTGELHGAPFLQPEDLLLGEQRTPHRLVRPAADSLDQARQAAIDTAPDGGPPRILATTIGVIATDVSLTKAQCSRVAMIGHDGMARAIDPVHTLFDGDTLFAMATADRPAPGPALFHELMTHAAHCVTRSIVRAVLSAETVSTPAGSWRSYRDALPGAVQPAD